MSLTNSPFWMAQTAAGSFYDYEIANSARMTSDNSSYLQRTPSTSGNRDTWTFSCWMKRTELNGGGERIFGAGDDLVSPGNHNNTITLYFDNHRLRFRQESGGSANMDLLSSALYRDTSAWYHIMCVYDSTNGTSGDRARMYVNGERITALSINDPDPGSGTDSNCMRAGHIMRIGRSTSGYHNHNLAEVHWVDGSALEPTSFGETKSGVWVPKEYSGSYGTNGVYLKFANSAAFGTDSSGNGNTFSTGGLTTHDQLPDSPTNNFSTLNPNAVQQNGNVLTFSEGSLKVSNSSSDRATLSTFGMSSGKWYLEAYVTGGSNDHWIGVWKNGEKLNGFGAISQTTSASSGLACVYQGNGGGVGYNGSTQYTGSSYTGGDYIGCCFDADDNKVYFHKNGTWQNSADPSAGTGGVSVSDGEWLFYISANNSGQGWIANFGQDSTFAGTTTAGGNADGNGYGDFKYAVESGFLALCTANLPAPAIDPAADDTPEDYFNTVLWTGTGSGQSITGMGFQPDWLWFKSRNNSNDHALIDSVRGVNQGLVSNSTAAEVTSGSSNDLVSFDSDGFTTGTPQYFSSLGSSGFTIATWGWKAGGTGVSNTDGSITSTVSANQDSGFSIVTYTGNATAGATVGHGLGKKPTMIIVKNRDDGAQDWPVQHGSIGATGQMVLSSTAANNANIVYWNNTEPTSSVFSLGTANNTNQSGDSHVAYCFTDIDGFSKAGSYIGNGSSDGPFIYTGFRPAWVMIKNTNSTGGSGQHWQIADNKRDTYNLVDTNLLAENVAAEGHTWSAKDFLSNGFKIRGNNYALNYSGDKYIYLAFAEQPFKYANAR